MNQIINTVNTATMSSVELVSVINTHREKGKAELLHKNFIVKVENHPGIDSAKFLAQYKDSTGRSLKCYHLPKRECELMVMSESLAVQAKVYDRMAELEQRPVFVIPTTLSSALMLASQQAEQIEQQQAQLAIASPKADALDLLTLADGSMCITNAAKAVSKQPKAMFAWLQTNDWIYRRPGGVWCAYQDRIKSGMLTHKITTVSRSDGTEKIVEQVLVTAKGLAKLAEVAI